MLKQLTDSTHRPTHEEIARVAYAIFEKNGKIPGKDQDCRHLPTLSYLALNLVETEVMVKPIAGKDQN